MACEDTPFELVCDVANYEVPASVPLLGGYTVLQIGAGVAVLALGVAALRGIAGSSRNSMSRTLNA